MTDGALALVPARGGSKGIANKNLRTLGGLSLVAHAIECAQLCKGVSRIVVSTDSAEIADVARAHGADVPFLRPAELAQDDTPMWPVVRHAVEAVGGEHEFVVLLDPTSPGRLPSDVDAALERLRSVPEADGIVGVSVPDFNPIWVCVVERDGYLAPLIEGDVYARRQDVPPVFRINASLYVWRTSFVHREHDAWQNGRLLMHEIPDERAFHIDAPQELERAEALLAAGLITLPWLA
jgi:CMP-N,N'-diacetyllegionaminic acid synthase